MPSLPGLADDHGVDWKVYAAADSYPVAYYEQLKGSSNIRHSAQFVADVEAGKLPTLCFLYHDPPLDEHPPANVTQGMNATWQAVDAVVRQQHWADTVFMLTWD